MYIDLKLMRFFSKYGKHFLRLECLKILVLSLSYIQSENIY